MRVNLDNLLPGESAIYYTGVNMAQDCIGVPHIAEARHTAWEMYMRGECDLVQRRAQREKKNDRGATYKEAVFDYICQRRRVNYSPAEVYARNEFYNRKTK